ncbi:hypothetical protein [Alkalihalobacterium alkalinitrilicum]|uniref:hypothetical protein n=1 Tax=Alkalihalobacterium alkalinitrilicum TaxID=427920 RepID=UPI00099504F3|nr:hypothetical protein [Alkalihalobacterium alkalinitrilicum]
MELIEPELKVALEKLDSLIVTLPDKRDSVFHFKNFIISFLRTNTNNVTLPVSEVMAFLKNKKPTVFSILRNEYSHNLVINVVTHVDLEYKVASKRLYDLKLKLGIINR